MYRLRIINTNVVPSDHLLDVEGLPESFVQALPLQPKVNWVNKEKPEYMIDYKSNQWDELETLMNRFSSDGRIPKPARLVDTDDYDRARMLPRTLQDEDVPLLVLNTPEPMRKKEATAPVAPSFFCPECDFEGKTRYDIEGHMTSEHGIHVDQRSQDGKSLVKTKEPDSDTYPCLFESCTFVAKSQAQLRGHKMGAHKKQKVGA